MRAWTLLFTCLSALAQTPVISNIQVTNITHSTATIIWQTDLASTTQINWAYASASLSASACPTGAPACYYTQLPDVGSNLPVNIHSWFISGANANTTIYYQVVSTATGTAVSSIGSFTTLSQVTIPALPISPVPVDPATMPTGTPVTVAADCSNLASLWSANPGGIIEIDPSVTKFCTGFFQLANNGPPYTVLRVKNAATTFPGMRRVGSADKPKTARFIQTAMNVPVYSSSVNMATTQCMYQNYVWKQGQGTGTGHFSMYQCKNVNPQSITLISSSGNLVVTVAATSGYIEAFLAHVSGVSAINGDYCMHILNSTQVELHYPSSACGATAAVPFTGSASGGTIAMDQNALLSVTEFMGAIPSTCPWGSWYWKTDASTENTGVYYCNNTNEIVPVTLNYTYPGENMAPMLDLTTNNVTYAWFWGLSFEPMNLKGDGTPPQYIGTANTYPTGLVTVSFVTQGVQTNHIRWDDILVDIPDPNPNGFYAGVFKWALDMSGSQWHLGGSYLHGFQIWEPGNSILSTDTGTVVLPIYHTGPHEIVNNDISCAGICIYYPDDDASTTVRTDLTSTGNIITTPDKYWDTSPAWLGNNFHFASRHRFEEKAEHRAIIQGNQFNDGYVWDNNAAAICLCTRGGAIGGQFTTVATSGGTTLITMAPAAANSQGYPLTGVLPGDPVAFTAIDGTCTGQANKIFTVKDVPTIYTMHLTVDLACTNSNAGHIVSLSGRNNNITDQNIQYNTYLNSPTDMYFLGHDSYSGPTNALVGAAMQRIFVANNLSNGLDGDRRMTNATGPSGVHSNVLDGPEDMWFEHETMVNTVLVTISGASYHYQNSSQENGYRATSSSGFVLNNNIFPDLYPTTNGMWSDGTGSNYGQAALDASFFGATPAYTALNNVYMRPGGSAGLPHPYTPTSIPFNTSTGTFPFWSGTDFHIQGSSPFASGGASHASDGLDQGADIDGLQAAQGTVSNIHLCGAATVCWQAPKVNTACSVNWDTVSPPAAHTVAPSAVGAVYSVILSGAPTATQIYYQVTCGTQQPIGSFIN
jgi:hypothetical protein